MKTKGLILNIYVGDNAKNIDLLEDYSQPPPQNLNLNLNQNLNVPKPHPLL